jgi:hypothetical protein
MSNAGVIAGSVVGGLIGIGIILGVILWFRLRRRSRPIEVGAGPAGDSQYASAKPAGLHPSSQLLYEPPGPAAYSQFASAKPPGLYPSSPYRYGQPFEALQRPSAYNQSESEFSRPVNSAVWISKPPQSATPLPPPPFGNE